MSRGTLAFVGGGEFSPGCDVDAALLAECGAAEVVVLPTATAYENPARLRARAEEWFCALGVGCRWLDVYRRVDAEDPAAAGAGGNVLCDHMVDVRGGAFTVGLGLTDDLAMISRANTLSAERISRTVRLAPPGLLVAPADESRSRSSLTTPLRTPREPARVGQLLTTISASNSDATQRRQQSSKRPTLADKPTTHWLETNKPSLQQTQCDSVSVAYVVVVRRRVGRFR